MTGKNYSRACKNCGKEIGKFNICPFCHTRHHNELHSIWTWYIRQGLPIKIVIPSAAVFSLIMLLVVGSLSAGTTKTRTVSKTETKTVTEKAGAVAPAVTVTQTITVAAPPPTPPSPTTLSGIGQQGTQMFSLKKGLARFTMGHDGQSNFAIILMDNSGNTIELLVNEIGPFNGSKAVQVPSGGSYLLDISADGNWTVSIEQ